MISTAKDDEPQSRSRGALAPSFSRWMAFSERHAKANAKGALFFVSDCINRLKRNFRATLRCVLLVAALSLPAFAAENGPRKTLRIAGAWNLTASHHEHTKKEGTRVKLLTSTGKPTLKHGPNAIRGPWDLEATAETIQCDFEAKKFILSGVSSVVAKDKAGKTEREITGKAGATIEINFADLAIEAQGPTVTKIKELAPAAPNAPPPPAPAVAPKAPATPEK
jgi:hypothetical protein